MPNESPPEPRAAGEPSSSGVSSSRVLVSGLVVSVAVFAANASNFVFQVATGRLLSASEYGLLLSAFTLMGLLSVVISATQAAVSKTEAIRIARRQRLTTRDTTGLGAMERLRVAAAELRDDRLAMLAVQVGLAGGIVVALLSPLVADFLHSDLSVALAIAASVPTLGTSAIVFGRLQGRQRFQLFAIVSLSLALMKLGGGIGALAIGFGTSSVLLVVATSTLAVSVWGLLLVRAPGPSGLRALAGEIVRALVVLACWRAIIGMDIPLARFWLPEQLVGQYAAAGVIGRGILWLPEIVSFMLFPSLASAVAEGRSSKNELRRSLVLTVGLCAFGVVVLRVMGPWIFSVLYGSKYPDAADYAWKVALAALPNAAANLFMFAALARQAWNWVFWLVAGVGVQVVAMVLFHRSPDQLIMCAALGGIVTLLVTWTATRRPAGDAGEPAAAALPT